LRLSLSKKNLMHCSAPRRRRPHSCSLLARCRQPVTPRRRRGRAAVRPPALCGFASPSSPRQSPGQSAIPASQAPSSPECRTPRQPSPVGGRSVAAAPAGCPDWPRRSPRPASLSLVTSQRPAVSDPGLGAQATRHPRWLGARQLAPQVTTPSTAGCCSLHRPRARQLPPQTTRCRPPLLLGCSTGHDSLCPLQSQHHCTSTAFLR
jgi:hypothetical protein